MKKQLIISIGREYGSRGHEIGEKLSKKLGLDLYDRNILDEVAIQNGANVEDLSKYDERPKHHFFSRTVRGYSNNPAVNVAELQFALLKSKAADGDSFIVIGRCSDEIFKGIAETVSIFITADYEDKLSRIMKHRNFSKREAENAMEKHDKRRSAYHNTFCKTKWGEASSYDISVNMSKLGIEGTAEFLYRYITDFRDK